MAASIACLLLILSITTTTTTSAHNITAILSANPDYSAYSDLLIKTKVSDEINNRQTITVLVLNNKAINTFKLKSQTLQTLKTLLSIHVLLDYFDSTKLQNLPDASTTSTNLYQTSGVATQRNGYVNITDSKGKVFFTTATPGSKPTSQFTKPISSEPYNISVLEISAPIDAPGLLNLNPNPTKDLNLTALLISSGCKKFADLINKEKVIQDYDGVMTKGLSVFAPKDDAWNITTGMPDWTKMSDNDLKTVLRYHAAPNYFPVATLKGMKEEFITLATIGGDRYGIVPEASNDFLLLKTGVDSARVVNTIVDSAPVVVLLIDNVLLPVELFGNKSTNSTTTPPSGSPVPLPSIPAPASPKPPHVAPTPASGPAITPPGNEPSQSPPAPSGETPETSPGPVADEDQTPPKKSGGSRGNGGELWYGLFVAMVIGVLSLMML